MRALLAAAAAAVLLFLVCFLVSSRMFALMKEGSDVS